MRVIIAGGRLYSPSRSDIVTVAEILEGVGVTEIVSGGAKGGDTVGELIAWGMNLPVKRFLPNWDEHGRGAGFIRNEEMAKYGDVLIALPGKRGTADMVTRAEKHELRLFDLRSI